MYVLGEIPTELRARTIDPPLVDVLKEIAGGCSYMDQLNNRYHLSLTNLRDALHHGKRGRSA